jgi:WhiB family redox-sensing transcriptional regulator
MPGNLIDLPSIGWKPQPWRSEAACKGEPVDVWFATQGHGVKVAKRICNTCPVRIDCLKWAVEEQINHGIYGGRTPRERRMLRRGSTSFEICGTIEGANAHLDANQPLCPACLGVRHYRHNMNRLSAKHRELRKGENRADYTDLGIDQ